MCQVAMKHQTSIRTFGDIAKFYLLRIDVSKNLTIGCSMSLHKVANGQVTLL